MLFFSEWIFPLMLGNKKPEYKAESKDTAGTPVLYVLPEA